ncbi:TIGR04282 family arsenosugar biosynthesis glycosyltransferase [Halomonas sp. KG2]|uniref:TIGR04282 family arsenosugar biosynthesis glycosyltransferase n=1 Tax=Halomonas sp. KG2 TaxID=2951138 RepID=UPI00264728D2|nr:TIGR04282 family arsenosugar biosynthesis glycosyltransferase [Halomonas sp. KG2]WKD28923.1 TIGR04282 family arsenosugar biosynthesis glycosyltransferase [Halomonas sp. KG2]
MPVKSAVQPHLHLLAKAPLPGQAKTRLIPCLGPEGAAQAHATMVRHCVATACQALGSQHVTLWTSLEHQHPLFVELQSHYGISLATQRQGDVGMRVRHALNSTQGPSMVMGTDCPSITVAMLRQCSAALKNVPVVILPAEDGGYGLIGTHDDHPSLFEGIPWGTAQVLQVTRQRLAALTLDAIFPDTMWDIDRPEDWQRWQQTLKHANSL